MTRKAINNVCTAIAAFGSALERAEASTAATDSKWFDPGPVAGGELRRASMELTRSLARLRRSGRHGYDHLGYPLKEGEPL